VKTDTYANLLTLIQAWCGTSLGTTELARINAFVNHRARRVHKASDHWPRFLKVGEERTCGSTGLVPFSQTSKDDIDTFLVIHRTDPYKTLSAQEFDFYVDQDGAQIQNYTANDDGTVFVTYRAELDVAYGTGSGQTATVPEEWFDYLAHGAYADWLRSEGQTEKAALEDAVAETRLMDELEKVGRMHIGRTVANRVRTNANMQLR